MDSATLGFSAGLAFATGLSYMVLERIRKVLTEMGHDKVFIDLFIALNREKIKTCVDKLFEHMDIDRMVKEHRKDYIPYSYPELAPQSSVFGMRSIFSPQQTGVRVLSNASNASGNPPHPLIPFEEHRNVQATNPIKRPLSSSTEEPRKRPQVAQAVHSSNSGEKTSAENPLKIPRVEQGTDKA